MSVWGALGSSHVTHEVMQMWKAFVFDHPCRLSRRSFCVPK